MRLRKNACVWNGPARQACPIKLRNAMFDRMHGVNPVELLRVRHANVVHERILVSRPTDAPLSTRKSCQHCAARAAVLIENDRKAAFAQSSCGLDNATL